MRIGDIARIAGVSTRTIRHYHRIGLVPEAARESNGYRTYALDEVVLLLRIRRLVELGMSLDEIGDVLDEDERGRDLDEVLAELDADLARQEAVIRDRRRQLAELRAGAAGAPMPERVGAIADRIAAVYGGGGAAARMELAVMEVLTGVLPGAVDMYEAALDDPAMTALSGEIAVAFDALHAAGPDDPRVSALADRIVSAAAGLELPETVAPGSPRITADDVTGWLDSAEWMSDAQHRCIALIVRRLSEAAS